MSNQSKIVYDSDGRTWFRDGTRAAYIGHLDDEMRTRLSHAFRVKIEYANRVNDAQLDRLREICRP